MRFSVTILGSNSALPTSHRNPTAQLLNVAERFFLFDCGEGTQVQLRKNRIKFTKINHIFISHLHGDHCFGLIGLISTLGLLNRTQPLFIHAHCDLELLLRPQLDYFCVDLPYEVIFISVSPNSKEIVFEDDVVKISSFPLEHRVPTVGFLVEEKRGDKIILNSALKAYRIPVKDIPVIKSGKDWINFDGETISNHLLTEKDRPLRSYAFCSDTLYLDYLSNYIKGISLLYHESTFAHDLVDVAIRTTHSTALQAAKAAKDIGAHALAIGHFSSRYKSVEPLVVEATQGFSNTYEAKEGRTFFINNTPEISILIEDIS
ncbi:MAG: ribonuclease Z [Breznakibacter sp.]|nr:ribonuclease Z [Breznakibacter sp.]